MQNPICEIDLEIDPKRWSVPAENPAWIAALEAGRVLYFPHLAFVLNDAEKALLRPDIRDPKSRNISLGADNQLKGAAGSAQEQQALSAMIARFRDNALSLIHSMLPAYTPALRLSPASFRPADVGTRKQSVRANDRLLHVDAFPSRPNYGERILRVFTNINPVNQPRVWRVGEPFEAVAQRFLPQAKPYSAWQAKLLQAVHVTKTLRSEYDHLMLQLHDAMKSDQDYQKNAPQVQMAFPPGSTWVCFSDQTSHAVLAGQYMLELTLHLPPDRQYDHEAHPLAILSRLAGHSLV